MKSIQSAFLPDIGRISSPLALRSGETLQVRLIRPEEDELLAEFASRLSPKSRRRRFHQSVENLSTQQIRDWTQLLADVDNRTLGGAVLAINEMLQIVGVARLGRVPGKPHDPTADAAIVIRDDYQGQGLGTKLLRRLVLLAQQMKVRQMTAFVEADNAPALHLFRALGLPSEIEISMGETTMTIEMPQQNGRLLSNPRVRQHQPEMGGLVQRIESEASPGIGHDD